jgi:ubiquinone/menaquinone biosynthesis C-methylase UbiE
MAFKPSLSTPGALGKWIVSYARGKEHEFYDNDPAGYERVITTTHKRHIAAKRVHDLLQKQFGGKMVERIVDTACGTGLVTRAIAPLAQEVIGMDLSSGMLDYAAHHPDCSANARWMLADFHKIPLENESTNAYTMIGASRFITDDQAFFREMYRILVPGGIAIMGTADLRPQTLRRMREFCENEGLFQTEAIRKLFPAWFNTVRRLFGAIDALILRK